MPATNQPEVNTSALAKALGKPSGAAKETPPAPIKVETEYIFETEAIATACGLKLESFKKYIREGKVDPSDLGALVEFISSRRKSTPYVLIADSQKRAEAAAKIGVIVLAQRSDGEVIFALPIKREGDFVEMFDATETRLRNAKYALATWTSKDGVALLGWSRED